MDNEIKKTGHCKHGEFVLLDGCPQCIEEARAERLRLQGEIVPEPVSGELTAEAADALEEATRQGVDPDYEAARADQGPPASLVKVRYYSETTGALSPREYTYFTVEPLAPGDVVKVPVQDRIGKAKVTAVNVPESEIAAFRDKVKTIPAGSLITEDAPKETRTPAAGSPDPGPYAVQEFPQEAPTEGEHVEQLWDEQKAAERGVPPALVTIERQVGKPTSELFQLYQEAASLLKFAKTRVIATNADLKPAADDLAIISTCRKAMFERKTEFVGPLKAKLDLVNQAFADLMFPVEEADRLTRGQVKGFEAEQTRKAAEAKRIEDDKARLAREEAALSGTGEITVALGTAQAPPPVPEHTRTELGTLGGRDNWKARVLDFALLPDEYKLPNEQLLNSFARTNKGQRVIPGVEFYNDRIVTMRTK